MIVVRNVFRLRFGQAHEAVALWREGLAFLRQQGASSARILTDVTGSFYTLVMEDTHESLAAFEKSLAGVRSDEAWKAWYARFAPLVESGYREILTVAAST